MNLKTTTLLNVKNLAVATGLSLMFAGCSSTDEPNNTPTRTDLIRGSQIVLVNKFGNDIELVAISEQKWEIEEGEICNDACEGAEHIIGPLPSWEYLEAKHNQKIVDMLATSGTSASSINIPIKAQIVTLVKELSSQDWHKKSAFDHLRNKEVKWDFPKDRKTKIATNYYIYSIYDFDNDRDFYIIEMETNIPNSNMWNPQKRTQWDGAIDKYEFQEFWMRSLEVNHTLSKLNGNNLESLPYNKLVMGPSSPATMNNQTTYSTSVGYSINAQIGYMSGGGTATINPGFSYSKSEAYTCKEFDVVSLINSNMNTPNASWRWKTERLLEYKKDSWGIYTCYLTPPPALSINTAKFGAIWIYIVNNPKKDDEYVLSLDYQLEYVSSAILWGLGFISNVYGRNFSIKPEVMKEPKIVLNKPNRIPIP